MKTIAQAIVTNAAGMLKTLEQARALLQSAVTRITIGSVTMLPRTGNQGVTYFYDSTTGTAWNSKGLDNLGIEELMTWLPDFYLEAKAAGKEVAVSLAGFTPQEYAFMAQRVQKYCDIIEVNAGCGNVWRNNEQKMPPSYSPDLLNDVLSRVETALGFREMVSVKISPVEDELIPRLAGVIEEWSSVVEIIGTNTMINQKPLPFLGKERLEWREDDDAEWKHTGGMSGAGLRPDSLRVFAQMRPLVRHLRYIYCGGVSAGQHLIHALEHGADGIAVGTAYFEEGPRIFSDIYEEALEA